MRLGDAGESLSMNPWKQGEPSAGISRKNDAPGAGSAAANVQQHA